jgi:hypothetical protein
MKPDERLIFDEPDGASKRTGAFVSVKLHFEESLVPVDASVEITDCQSHVCNGRQLGHESLLLKVRTSLPEARIIKTIR